MDTGILSGFSSVIRQKQQPDLVSRTKRSSGWMSSSSSTVSHPTEKLRRHRICFAGNKVIIHELPTDHTGLELTG